MTPDLPALIADLEAATGPDRGFDARIAEAIGAGLPMVNGRTISEALAAFPRDGQGIARAFEVAPYTASIDAALTLLPENIEARVARCPKHSSALVWVNVRRHLWGYAATPALALCIASLRARCGHE